MPGRCVSRLGPGNPVVEVSPAVAPAGGGNRPAHFAGWPDRPGAAPSPATPLVPRPATRATRRGPFAARLHLKPGPVSAEPFGIRPGSASPRPPHLEENPDPHLDGTRPADGAAGDTAHARY